jgi:hypothetical protein
MVSHGKGTGRITGGTYLKYVEDNDWKGGEVMLRTDLQKTAAKL